MTILWGAALTLLVSLQFVRADRICCREVNECFTDEPPFDHLPLPGCKDDVGPYGTLYTRNNGDGARIDANNVPSSFSPSRRTIFVVHGFLNKGNMDWLSDMRKGLLRREDANVIQMGWEEGAVTIDYPKAASNTRFVGAYIATIGRSLVERHGLPRTKLWCIGHSLGSHICGHAGARLKLGRITGLDPAGPLFENYDIKAGLNPSCAEYVDVLHTMGKNGIIMDFGTLKPLGHADFYPNGGKVQPGCVNYLRTNPLPYVDLTPICSHLRAIDYMQESLVGSCVFWARRQCTDEKNLPGSCSACGDRCAIMGYTSDTIRRAGKFYLQTNDDTPFCRG